MAKAIWAVSEGDRASLGCAGGGIALTHDKVAILVKRLSQECDKIAYPILQPYKLTLVQYKIIKYLYLHPADSIRQIDIERFYCLTNPTVTGILKNLERDGWIVRRANPKDGRSKIISLTAKAMEYMEAMYGAGDQIETELTAPLLPEEKQQLLILLNKLLSKEND